jgi:hypothetical protein
MMMMMIMSKPLHIMKKKWERAVKKSDERDEMRDNDRDE